MQNKQNKQIYIFGKTKKKLFELFWSFLGNIDHKTKYLSKWAKNLPLSQYMDEEFFKKWSRGDL